MGYDELYKNSNVWGAKPNAYLASVVPLIREKGRFLDLGCGQGRDAIFMWEQGFSVTAVDVSEEGIKNVIAQSKGEINAVCQNIEGFHIAPNTYTAINAWNVLQFLKKGDALRIVRSMQEGVADNGFLIISGFTVDDPAFQNQSNKDKGFFEKDELKKLFNGFKIIRYEEKVIHDQGHLGAEQPHKHGIVRLIAQKSAIK